MSLQTKTPGAGEQPGATIMPSKQRQFTYSPLVRQVAGGLLLLAIVAAGASIAYRTCRASRGTMSPALKSAGARNTIEPAVASPTESGLLSCQDSGAGRYNTAGRHDCGQGAAFREGAGTAGSVFRTPCPPYARRKANGDFLAQPGA